MNKTLSFDKKEIAEIVIKYCRDNNLLPTTNSVRYTYSTIPQWGELTDIILKITESKPIK